MHLMRMAVAAVAVILLAACAFETQEQRIKRETAASLLEFFGYDGYPQTFPEIAEQLRREAEAGNTRSQSRLAELYFYGFGVPRDAVERVKWHHRAADGGSALSQYFLAWSYLEGDVVEQDYRQALDWLRRSAAQDLGLARDGGSAQAQYDCLRPKEPIAGADADSEASKNPEADYSKLRSFSTKWIERHFTSGIGTWRWACDVDNNRRALTSLFRAANDGFPKAQYLIGIVYLSGRGIGPDRIRAAHWFLKAALQNHDPAQREYCALYRTGAATAGDEPPSAAWCEGTREP